MTMQNCADRLRSSVCSSAARGQPAAQRRPGTLSSIGLMRAPWPGLELDCASAACMSRTSCLKARTSRAPGEVPKAGRAGRPVLVLRALGKVVVLQVGGCLVQHLAVTGLHGTAHQLCAAQKEGCPEGRLHHACHCLVRVVWTEQSPVVGCCLFQ